MMFALSRLLCINYEIAMRKTAVCIGIANCAANVFYLVILALTQKKKKEKNEEKKSHHKCRRLGELGRGRLGGRLSPILDFKL